MTACSNCAATIEDYAECPWCEIRRGQELVERLLEPSDNEPCTNRSGSWNGKSSADEWCDSGNSASTR